MQEVDRLQDHYLATLELYTLEHLNLYNKAIFGLPENDRYYLTITKWKELYQKLEYAVPTFGFKSSVKIITAIYNLHYPSELNNVIFYYQ